jgi:omega-hydroxy-beta-dihydromenaquinone-9 sulfotransferase
MENAYLIAGMQLGVLARLVVRHGVSLHYRHLARLGFLLQSGMWSSALSAYEHLRYSRRYARAHPPTDPIFIVGHWRTGSTFLHQCLHCDERFTVPSLLQCCYPRSFVTARRFAEPLMRALLPEHRPMDNVKLGPGEPQEDEDALFRMTGTSPLERLIFPRSGDYFLRDITDGLADEPAQCRRWGNAFMYFTTKLAVHGGGRLVLKNPFNALRIPTLARLFPDAVFIHTYRDPRVVVPSTIRMWTIVGRQNTLRADWAPPPFEQTIEVFDRILTRLYHDLEALPENRRLEIRFEDLERHPYEVVGGIYRHLGLELAPAADERLRAFLDGVKNYRRNEYTLTDEQRGLIETCLTHHLVRGEYL